jgi:hypothetical protein
MMGAVDAWNCLVAQLCAVSAGDDMNLLPCFTMLAFHCHHDKSFVGHCCSPSGVTRKRANPHSRTTNMKRLRMSIPEVRG